MDITTEATAKAREKIEQQQTSEKLEILISKQAEVEQQLTTLTGAVKNLTEHQEIMDEGLLKHLERLSATPQPIATEMQQAETVDHRLNKIEMMLGDIALGLEAETMQTAGRRLISEAKKNHLVTESVIKKFSESIAQIQQMVARATKTNAVLEDKAIESISKAVDAAGKNVSKVYIGNLNAVNDRAEKIIAATDRLESRQIWSAVAAMSLCLLPVATVIAGLWLVIAGLVVGIQWAMGIDSGALHAILGWLAITAGVSGVCFALFISVRWVASLVGVWSHRGMPKWPSWRK